MLEFIERSKAERSRGGKMKYGVSRHDRRITFSEDNFCLAQACQIANAACCKKAKIFLPKAEMENILKWITAHIPSDLAEFKR